MSDNEDETTNNRVVQDDDGEAGIGARLAGNLQGLQQMFRDAMNEVTGRTNMDDDSDDDLSIDEDDQVAAAIQRLEDQRAATTQRQIANVFITDMLKAYPAEEQNSNKIILPHSIFNEIVDKKVFDNNPAGKPLIFKLEVADPVTGDVIETTYAGVDKFTAPDGKIGLPHKTALCLTKERGVGWLKQNPMVFLSYVSIPTHQETFMQVQPRGKGFHMDDNTVVQLDIKTILEQLLRDHIVVARGDWIPIYHEGKWYELVVRDTRPAEVLEVLNTDCTVDIMPSEDTENETKELEEAKQKLKDFINARNERGKKKEVTINSTPQPNKGDKDATMIRVRLPDGKTKTRLFKSSDLLGKVLDWVEVEMYSTDYVPSELPETKPDEYWFKLKEKVPGSAAKYFTGEEAWKSLSDARGGKKGGMSLHVEIIKSTVDEKKSGNLQATSGSESTAQENEWDKAQENLQIRIERSAAEEEEVPFPPEQIEELTDRLIAYGVNEEVARSVSARYPKEVINLESMGYSDRMSQAVALLQDNNGGVNAVIDALLASEVVPQPQQTTEDE